MTQSYVRMQSRFGIESVQATQTVDTSEAHRNATMSLLLPGAVLHLNVLLAMRKFRNGGNKAGALRGFELLEKCDLGTLTSIKLQRGANMVTWKPVFLVYNHVHRCTNIHTRVLPVQLYQFQKKPIPEDPDARIAFVESLMKFGISIVQYEKAYTMEDITM